jgi:hypothetical protein
LPDVPDGQTARRPLPHVSGFAEKSNNVQKIMDEKRGDGTNRFPLLSMENRFCGPSLGRNVRDVLTHVHEFLVGKNFEANATPTRVTD